MKSHTECETLPAIYLLQCRPLQKTAILLGDSPRHLVIFSFVTRLFFISVSKCFHSVINSICRGHMGQRSAIGCLRLHMPTLSYTVYMHMPICLTRLHTKWTVLWDHLPQGHTLEHCLEEGCSTGGSCFSFCGSLQWWAETGWHETTGPSQWHTKSGLSKWHESALSHNDKDGTGLKHKVNTCSPKANTVLMILRYSFTSSSPNPQILTSLSTQW